MHGAGMADFARSSVVIAKAGIYDLRLHHDEVVMPLLRHWRVFERDGLGPRAEQAREELAAFLADLDKRATRFVDRREQARAAAPVSG
jgi:acyl-[acyl-carrier-protein] desaturase